MCINVGDCMRLEKDTTIKYMFREIHDITPEIVREMGLEAILFDLDNNPFVSKGEFLYYICKKTIAKGIVVCYNIVM